MGRDLRYILPNSLQHVVDVVAQNHHLLCPSPEVNDRYLGILGKAQRTYEMTICAGVVMSTHAHLLLRPRDGKHLADFMCFLKTNVSKEIGGRIRGWPGPFFGRRYHSTTVSAEASAQVSVLRYILSHGPKENLVDSVRQWPGVHCAESLIEGTPMVGRWWDRSMEYIARQTLGEGAVDPQDFVSEEAVIFSPLPCWEHLPESMWRRVVAEMVDAVDREAAAERLARGVSSLGVEGVLSQDPYERPSEVERSPKPRFHTASREAYLNLLGIWRQVVEAYYVAAERLKAGELDVPFPEGTFPPALPFVPFAEAVAGARGDPD